MRTYSKNESLIIQGAGSHGHVIKEIAESMGIFRRIDSGKIIESKDLSK